MNVSSTVVDGGNQAKACEARPTMTRSGAQGDQATNTVFVVGPPRSGTTLLGFMLGGGPDVLSLSEPYLARSIFGARRLKRHFGRLAKKSRLRFEPPPDRCDDGEFLAYLERFARLNCLGSLIVKETFREGKDWDNVALLDWAAGGSRPVLGITRHPYDAAVSTLRFCKWWRGVIGHLIRLYIPRLPLFANDEILMDYFAANWSGFARWAVSHSVPILRYEELIRDPSQVMQSTCKRVGLPFHPEMADSSIPRRAFGGIGAPEVLNRKPRPVHAKSVGRKKELPPGLVDIVRTGCRDAAAELGYDL